MKYNTELENLLREYNLFKRYRTIDEMLKRYRKIVDFLIRVGYSDYVAEFDNDISVRNDIEKILASEKFSLFQELKIFQQKVFEIDIRLKELFIPFKERSRAHYWWDKGILKNGHGNYANDIKLMYGININAEESR